MYITSDFDIKNTPKTPEYSQLENWAVLPDQWPIELEGVIENSGTKTADVFYIYPTLFTNKKNPQWNADIYNNEIRKENAKQHALSQKNIEKIKKLASKKI